MYGALWRALPGPAWVKAFGFVVGVAAIAVVCILWVFPAVQSMLPQEEGDITVGFSVIEHPQQEV